jgi:hypothetical protein
MVRGDEHDETVSYANGETFKYGESGEEVDNELDK